MFAFELTPRQAVNLSAHADALGANVCGRNDVTSSPDPLEPEAALTNMVIDQASQLAASEPLTGTIHYESSHSLSSGFVVRLMYELPDGATAYHFDHPMGYFPAVGVLGFGLTPLAVSGHRLRPPLPKTLPVFVTLCRHRAGDNGAHVPISNTCVTLIDLANAGPLIILPCSPIRRSRSSGGRCHTPRRGAAGSTSS